jgi:hypothetical protein
MNASLGVDKVLNLRSYMFQLLLDAGSRRCTLLQKSCKGIREY